MKKNVRLSAANHQAVKIIAAEKGVTLEEVVNDIIKRSVAIRKGKK